MQLLSKDYRYAELVDLIESIGYKHRVGNYYVIRENDGYINISYLYNDDVFFHKIEFHKNFYFTPVWDFTEHFDDFESFHVFITKYHNDLFLKHKIK